MGPQNVPAPSDELERPHPSEAADQAPSDSDGSDAPSDDAKRLRDRLAERGREIAEERRARAQLEARTQALQAEVRTLTQTVGGMYQHLSREQQAQQEASLNAMPPAERAEARARMLEQRLDALTRQQTTVQQPAVQQPQTDEDAALEYARQRSRELIDFANSQYGLIDGQEITADDLPKTAWRSEDAFTAALEVIASQRSRTGGTSDMAGKKVSERDKLKAEAKQEVLAELGISKPNAARPTGSGAAPNMADLNRTVERSRMNVRGSAGVRQQLQAQRDDIAARMKR